MSKIKYNNIYVRFPYIIVIDIPFLFTRVHKRSTLYLYI